MAGYSVTFSVVDQATAEIDKINRRIRQMREPMERQAKVLREFADLSGLKKIADSFTAIARSGAEAFSSLVRLVPVMGAITGAASLAGLANLVKGWDELGQGMAENSTRIGTTSQNLEQLENAMTLAGGEAKDMDAGLKGLTEALGRAQLGDAEAGAWFRKAHIAIRDTNGELRKSVDVLPEVIDYINSLKNPTDRMRAAQHLGAEALAEMAEQLQRSGRTLPQWLAEAQKFATLSVEQQQSLQRYRQATGELEVAFSSLKEQIGATLGEALTPLIKEFAEWVKTHQPQIVQSVHELVKAFADWVRGIDWKSVEAGAKSVGDAIVYLLQHLDQVKEAAEVIAALFAAKWAIGIVGSIAQVSSAIGVAAGVGGVGGLGLLGALGGVIFLTVEIIRHWDDLKKAGADLFASLKRGAADVGQNIKDWWEGKSGPNLPKPGETPGYPVAPLPPGAPPGGGKGGLPESPLDGAGYRQRAGELTNRLTRELNLRPEQAAGLVGNLGYESAGLQSGIHEGGQAADKGGIGWAQWTGPRRREFEAFAKTNNLDVKSDQANEAFLLHELKDPRYAGFMNQLRQAKSTREASDVVLHGYEKPADPAATADKRASMADTALASAQQQAALPTLPPAPQQVAASPQTAPQVAANENQPGAPQLTFIAPAGQPDAPQMISALPAPVASQPQLVVIFKQIVPLGFYSPRQFGASR